jgi:hypothetical protein
VDDWAAISWATNGEATSVYKCMSKPSNVQPSHAAAPERHWSAVSRDGAGASVAGRAAVEGIAMLYLHTANLAL